MRSRLEGLGVLPGASSLRPLSSSSSCGNRERHCRVRETERKREGEIEGKGGGQDNEGKLWSRVAVQFYSDTPYSGKFSREKTFVDR